MMFCLPKSLKRHRNLIVSLAIFAFSVSLIVVASTSAQQRPRVTRASDAMQQAQATPQQIQATPTPIPQTGPGRRIAPQLGAPPPAPILKPKPTPPPNPNDAEIDENSKIVVNTELVTLHVRVIDRNNHPINNIRKDDFKVLEDNVPQPIFSFTEEEVP